ncbi:MAG TPA: cohesin domain-containing protein [Candidatus Limnocylindrales bacterium]|nr:cohesin domain-containing protein [Candidatus Limnocylindrales bacterium]
MEWLKRIRLFEKYGVPLAVVASVAVIGTIVYALSQAAAGPQLYVTPDTTTISSGAELSVTVRADSQTEAVNSVQAALSYDASQLQFVGLDETGPFSYVAATDTATAGIIRVARAVPQGSAEVSGDHAVVVVRFKVIATMGTIAVGFQDDASLLVRGSDNTNVLTTTTGASIAIASSEGATANLTLSPATANAAAGSAITVTVQENSGTTAVNSVQASIAYDPAQLQYLSITEGTVFTKQAATDTSTSGRIRVDRSVAAGGAGVSGQNDVVSVTFKVLGSSGTTSLSIDKANSFVIASSDNKDILTTVAGSSLTLAASTGGAQKATFSLSPASGEIVAGATISVAVKVSSSSLGLTTVQPIVSYPAAQLEYVGVTEGGVFGTVQRTRVANGVVDIIRGISGGSAGVTGDNPVVTLQFKVIGTQGTVGLALTAGSAAYDGSGTGTNVLDAAASTGANYTLGAVMPNCAAAPSTPGAPTRTTFDYTSVSFTWAASNAAPDCTLAGYHVLRDGAVIADVMNGTSYTVSGLQAGSSHHYAVQAFDTNGHSSAVSIASTLATQADNVAPEMPEGVTATAESAAGVRIAWTETVDQPNPGGSGVAGYYIYRNAVSAPTYTVTTGTELFDTNVTADTTYSYTIAAYDTLGNISAPSNAATVRTAAPTCSGTPSTPTNLTAGTTTFNSTSLSWSPSTASDGCTLAGYRVFRSGILKATVPTPAYTDTGLQSNTMYEYTVQAFDTSANSSSQSLVLAVTTDADTTAPTAPSAATATVLGSGHVRLDWQPSTDNESIASYNLYRNGTLFRNIEVSTLSFSDTLVQAGTEYRYEIAAVDAAGNQSVRAATVPATVRTPAASDAQAPSAPSGLVQVAVSTRSASIAWKASTDNTAVTGYHVYRDGVFIDEVSGPTFTDVELTPESSYAYSVKAYDAAGNVSVASHTLQVRTLALAVDARIGDLNGDDAITIYDLSILLTHWQQRDVPPLSGDITRDGRVDLQDLDILLSHYEEGV